jgi:hypothetical protein
MKKLTGGMALLIFLVSGNSRALTPQEKKADRPADLGPVTIDVTSYPREQQENYQIFLSKCSRCHTPARPINSKITTEEDWEHFVSMMHGRLLSRSMGPAWKPQEGRRIIDFLTYDSKIRKLDHKLAFEEQLRKLNERYQEVQKEKAKEAKNQPTKPSAPYTGANP